MDQLLQEQELEEVSKSRQIEREMSCAEYALYYSNLQCLHACVCVLKPIV